QAGANQGVLKPPPPQGLIEEARGLLHFARAPNPAQPRAHPATYFFTYFFTRRGPTSPPETLPAGSATTPSAGLVPVAFSSGSGMKYITLPSFALPMRMPRFQSWWLRETDFDSESAT